jgi:hypothetical protein
MQEICKAHVFISMVAILLVPFNPAAVLMIILLNCSFMLRRILKCQQRSEESKHCGAALRAALHIMQVGMDVMTAAAVLSAAALLVLYTDVLRSSPFIQLTRSFAPRK